MSRGFAARVALLGIAALAIRLLYILVIARIPVGIGGDAGFYHSAANQIADGHFYYRGIFGHYYATAEHPPLYSLLLSVSSLLGGTSLGTHRVVGCVFGSLAVVVVGALAERTAGERAGLIAASIAAAYPPFITADGLVMSEPLFVLGVGIALLAALHLRSAPSAGSSAILGVCIGFCTLTRSEGVLLLALLGWPAAWKPAVGRWRRMLAVTLATAAVLAPWLAHNVSAFHRLTLATDANTVIAGANCHDTYYGHDIGWWSLDCMAASRTRAQLLAGDASTRTATRYARRHIGRLPLVAAVRVLRTFDLYQPLRQGNREPRRRWVDIVGLAFYFPVLLLGALGLRRVDSRWLWLAPLWMAILVSVLGWGIGRFRLPADVSLIVLASCALAAGWPARRRRAVRA